MPNPDPNTEHLTPWQPGQSGNPEGYSRRRRLADKLAEAIEANGYDEDLIRAIVGKATGRVDLLKDDDGKPREPSLEWFNTLTTMVDGPAGSVDAAASDLPPRIKLPDVDERYQARVGPGPPEAGD